jgi:uncharacterized protein
VGTRKVSKDAETLEDDLADPADGNGGAEEWASFSYVNGFITAVIVSPKSIDTAEWLSLLLEVPQEELTEAEVTPARELLLMEYRSILDSLTARDGSYSPFFWDDDDEGRLMSQDWAEGFLAGMELRKNAWDRVLEDENLRTALLLILTLLRDEEFLASIEEGGGPTPEESLLAAQEELPLAIQNLFEASPHGVERRGAALQEPEKKVGRNDPCPCGSGKKYKKCCLN